MLVASGESSPSVSSRLAPRTGRQTNWRPLRRPLCTLLLDIAVLWAIPGNAHAQLYVGQFNNGSVGEYDAITGAAINANFITGPNSFGLALSGNNLFVANWVGTTVGEYDATTGVAVNANFITGLNNPTGLALSGGNLFVSSYNGGTVGEYDAATGDPIDAAS
jgi:hypothetical protein